MKKSIDSLAQRIVASGFALAMVIMATLFGFSTLVNNPVKADSPALTNETGKIMMDQSIVVKDGKFFFHILVWDTGTGKSKLYWHSGGELTKVDYQLPASPLY